MRALDLDAPAGSVLAVLGPNGAGKTTLLLTLGGMLSRLGGDVTVDGHSLPSGKPGAANRAGMVLVPDDRALFTTLTVKENLSLACGRKGSGAIDEMRELFPELGERWDMTAGTLSGGEQQMLAVARGLVQRPRVLLIDEMSMGLAPLIVERLLTVVRHVADTTNAVVVLVEQHVHLALEIADDVIVLVHGDVSLRGPAATIAADAGALEAAYLGAEGLGE